MVEDETVPVSNVLQSLGVSSQVESPEHPHAANYDVLWKHLEDSHKSETGTRYPPTHAEFYAVYNPLDGVIISYYSTSPVHAIKQSPALQGQPPPLSRWSDVVFLEYQAKAVQRQQQLEKLRYILHVKCKNDRTQAVVSLALGSRGLTQGTPVWEHKQVFRMDDVWGQALLGTPNGEGVAWLLINHKSVWGRKRVKSVAVYLDPESATIEDEQYQYSSLLFELEDVGSGEESSGVAGSVAGGSSGSGGGPKSGKGKGKRPSDGSQGSRYGFRTRPKAGSGQ